MFTDTAVWRRAVGPPSSRPTVPEIVGYGRTIFAYNPDEAQRAETVRAVDRLAIDKDC